MSTLVSRRPAGPGASMTSLARVVRNFGYLAAATVIGQILGFVVLALVTRRVDPAQLGTWYFAASIVGYVGLVTTVGLHPLATRQIARDPAAAPKAVGEVVAWHLAAGVVAYAVIWLLAPTIAGGDELMQTVLRIAALQVVITAADLGWVLQAFQRGLQLAASRLSGQVVYAVLAVSTLAGGARGVERYAWWNVAGVAFSALVALGLVMRARVRIRRPTAAADVLTRVRASLPFAAANVLASVYWGLGPVFLALLATSQEAGLFGVAMRLPMVLVAFSAMYVLTAFPQVSLLAAADPAALRRQISRVTLIGAGAGATVVAGASLYPGDVVAFFFGGAYHDAGTTFAVLAGAAAIQILALNFGTALTAMGFERVYMKLVGLGAVVAVLGNLALVPRWGAVAPAGAILAAEVLLLAGSLHCLRRTLGTLEIRTRELSLAIAIPATAAVTWQLADVPLAPIAATAVFSTGLVTVMLVLARGRRWLADP